jgi:hypothetical protein
MTLNPRIAGRGNRHRSSDPVQGRHGSASGGGPDIRHAAWALRLLWLSDLVDERHKPEVGDRLGSLLSAT